MCRAHLDALSPDVHAQPRGRDSPAVWDPAPPSLTTERGPAQAVRTGVTLTRPQIGDYSLSSNEVLYQSILQKHGSAKHNPTEAVLIFSYIHIQWKYSYLGPVHGCAAFLSFYHFYHLSFPEWPFWNNEKTTAPNTAGTTWKWYFKNETVQLFWER